MRSIVLAFLLGTAALATAAPAAAQSFGVSAAVAGDEVAFGQPGTERAPGSVHVYRRASDSWTRTVKLTASDGIRGDRFGASIDVSDGRMIVGAFWADSGRGAAYVFERGADGGWRESARLRPAGTARGDSVGGAVAIDGDLALVSVAGAGDSTAGTVHAFRRDGRGAWTSAGRLEARELAPEARFGRTLDLADGIAFVGAVGADDGDGAVLVYRAGADGWSDPAVLAGRGGARLGAAVLAEPGRLMAGAPGLGRGRGAVLVYEPDETGEWQETGRLRPFAAGPRTLFGVALSRRGDEVWVGASGADRFAGTAYRFRRDPDTGEWGESLKVDLEGLERGDAFGTALALGDGVAAVGLPGDDHGAGTGAIFVREDGSWRFAERVWSEIEGLDPVVSGAVRCEGTAAGFGCERVDLLSFLPVGALGGGRGVELNDVWGWTDPETGREYALAGRSDGTSFVDVTDPVDPVYLGDLPMTEGANASTWRDIKVYENHAFVVSDNAGEHGMQVFDLARLRDVGDEPAVFEPDTVYMGIHSAHNVVIDTESGFAYVVGSDGGGRTCGGGLHMVDIRDPLNPSFVGCFSDERTGRRGTGYTHDAQCVVYRGPDADYEGRQICFGANETALSIADVTDKASPEAIAVAEYPNAAYTHQGWLTEDHRHFVLNDELDEIQGLVENTRTLVWDVADLDDPVLVAEYLNPNTNATDHNLYVVGDKVYQSNYVTGLRVLDISDIENPREVGHFDTMPYGSDGPRFDGSWSNYPFFESRTLVVTSGHEGLFLLRFRDAGEAPGP